MVLIEIVHFLRCKLDLAYLLKEKKRETPFKKETHNERAIFRCTFNAPLCVRLALLIRPMFTQPAHNNERKTNTTRHTNKSDVMKNEYKYFHCLTTCGLLFFLFFFIGV